mmetsp:Transcript_60256/g.126084  ORF Transcript_60256/g.126084 Transcript_60256/m.126084 type:complete len:88 (+) Transcript_60256:117-380(+)
MKTHFALMKHECLSAGGEDALYARMSQQRRSDLARGREAEHKLYAVVNPHAQASYVVVIRADNSFTGWRQVPAPVDGGASARAGMHG